MVFINGVDHSCGYVLARVQSITHPDPYPVNDLITLSCVIVRTEWSLYLALAITPAFVLPCYIIKLSLQSLPIDGVLGLTSLAGIDPSSLGLLHGAGLSGKLREKVYLRIGINEVENGKNGASGRLCYKIERLNNTIVSTKARARLKKGVKYEKQEFCIVWNTYRGTDISHTLRMCRSY